LNVTSLDFVGTPLRPDPQSIQLARDLYFEPPLDPGIECAVHTLIAAGVETFESCEGGAGHTFMEPTIKFEGDSSEGFRALAVALSYALPVYRLRRVWGVIDQMPHGPWWELTLAPPGKAGR
jgi:hypothetical protein